MNSFYGLLTKYFITVHLMYDIHVMYLAKKKLPFSTITNRQLIVISVFK